MNLKKKLRKFFNMARRDGGFTLVELVVVIAILGVLAGVAVPAYSGYVKKANLAADQQALGHLNTAFMTACVENGLDPKTVQAENITISASGDDKGKVADDDLRVTSANDREDKIEASFANYFEGAEFKVMTKLNYVNGRFENADDGARGGIYGQIFRNLGTALAPSVEKINASEFGEMGADVLMDKLDMVTGLSNDLALGVNGGSPNPYFQSFLYTTGANLPELLGYDMDRAMEDEEYAQEMMAAMDKVIEDKMTLMGTDDPTAAQIAVYSNLAVLNAAKNTKNDKTAAELGTMIQNGSMTSDMLANMMKSDEEATAGEGLGQAAMVYGLYTAWANGLDENDPQKSAAMSNADSIQGFIGDMNNASFIAYLQNTNGNAQKDLDGYVASMDIINQATKENPDAVSQLLINGYGDPDLRDAIGELLG